MTKINSVRVAIITKYGPIEHLGGEVTANSTSGIKGKNVKNRKDSEFRRRDNICN